MVDDPSFLFSGVILYFGWTSQDMRVFGGLALRCWSFFYCLARSESDPGMYMQITAPSFMLCKVLLGPVRHGLRGEGVLVCILGSMHHWCTLTLEITFLLVLLNLIRLSWTYNCFIASIYFKLNFDSCDRSHSNTSMRRNSLWFDN